MRISYNWLKDLLPELTQTPQEIAQLLTMHSYETVLTETIDIDPHVQVVKITNIQSHPNADRLRLATITNGGQDITVVCGAPNIEVGQVVPYSPPGTVLKDEEGDTLTVKEATIRGEGSPGMLNSLRELGLHPKAHEGIWILPSDLPIGSALSDHIPKDVILDADITPNRAHDSLSHLGVAREIAALLQINLQELEENELSTNKNSWSVTIEDSADTPRYMAVEVKNAHIAPSPMWLQARLLAAGGKPKNNLVDITNYVMFELGNPTHLFDAESLPAKEVAIRRARKGEKLIALDEEQYELSTDDLVIVNGQKPVAIAGVMGGLKTGVQANTKDLLLEIANFRSYLIQETSRRLNLQSESSYRFSRGLHPAQVELVAKRISYLLKEICDADIGGVIDMYPNEHQLRTISFRPSMPSQVAGTEIAKDEAADILRRLRCNVTENGEVWNVEVPYDRLDIEGEHDLVEEVIRVLGLENIPSQKISKGTPKSLPGTAVLRERLRDNLVTLGFTETYNYSFEQQVAATQLGLHTQPHLSLTNPPAPELANLRISLLPGLLANLTTNRTVFQRNSGRKESSLFEIGSIYKPGDSNRVPGVQEETHVAGMVMGTAGGVVPSQEDIVQTIADTYHVEPEIVKKTGTIQLLDPHIGSALKYQLPVTLFEFNVSELILHSEGPPARGTDISQSEAVQFVPYSKYPSTIRDISFLVDAAVSVEDVQSLLERTGGDLVVDVDIFDELEWKDTGKKALAFHIEYQAMDRTLTDDEVSKIHNQIVATLKQELAAEIR